MNKHTDMVVCAAKVLSQRQAKAYGDHPETHWGIFGNDLIEDAQAMLEAVGAPELLEAAIQFRRSVWTGDMDAMPTIDTLEMLDTAIAKASGEA